MRFSRPFVLLLFACAFVRAESLPVPAADKLESIPAKMQKFVDDRTVSGVVTLVATKDRTVHLAAVGKSDLATGRDMKTDDLFWIASMTKPITAVCVGILVDEGKIAWEDPVEKHLPEFKNQWVVTEQGDNRRVIEKSPRQITVRDLLTHSSGLGNVNSPRPHSTLAELCMAYSREPLFFAPGTKWNYSNSGINTLGRIVEVASGKPFADFLDERVLRPLGMKDTTFWPSIEEQQRLAKSYKRTKDGQLQEVGNFFIEGELADRERTPFPAGGLYSTAEDIAKVYQMMLQSGSINGRTYLKPETVAEMTKTQSGDLRTGFTDGMSWGYGFQVVREPQGVTAMLSPGTFGHGGAYGTNSWGDPKRGVAYILMIQAQGLPNADASDVRRVFQETAATAFATR
jgi:CubicO group peptidase (beta-lactamase class C family)